MTTAPDTPRPRALALVPDGDEPTAPAVARILHHWDPESQLLGALLHLPCDAVAPILELVPAEAIWRPEHRWIYELIDHLVGTGADPDPVVVLSTARHRPPVDAAHPGEPVTPGRHHRLAVHLADLYTRVITPAAAGQYAGEVLDNAYRRAVAFHGTRMTQLAETDADHDTLTTYLTAMRAELADLWRRLQAAHR
ncbi:DnaB-like helicase N-terminal domain-containing protein [Mycobacterium sp. 236(2023)]|uniref:DnaB-like helicase N-terminal domain-containing protein n=1 Tax=Mycobacterium sp. 236(2023) TaxID=3038163 RepID=UPI002414EECA|nr:DnaB-like helicase N-terminal domain-containing protein [Mycobacterium sp. 236(2023)]MDG4667931.1 DnaB-like helicase N-terminal domain-containing protein [Mycobacterium sp. 236(2023)]